MRQSARLWGAGCSKSAWDRLFLSSFSALHRFHLETRSRPTGSERLSGRRRKLALPIETGRGDCRIRQPIERDVVEDVVSRQALGLTIENARDERLTARIMIEHPGSQADRRIRNPVKRLRAVRHLLRVTQAVLIEEVELVPRVPSPRLRDRTAAARRIAGHSQCRLEQWPACWCGCRSIPEAPAEPSAP